jgi:hypothetical protein
LKTRIRLHQNNFAPRKQIAPATGNLVTPIENTVSLITQWGLCGWNKVMLNQFSHLVNDVDNGGVNGAAPIHVRCSTTGGRGIVGITHHWNQPFPS